MAITFYCGSGSPFSWKVWLALEHKDLPYALQMLSFSGGDMKTPDYLAVNPRGMVPTLVEAGMTLYDPNPIVDNPQRAHPAQPLLTPRVQRWGAVAMPFFNRSSRIA